jgi:hypothetical protein
VPHQPPDGLPSRSRDPGDLAPPTTDAGADRAEPFEVPEHGPEPTDRPTIVHVITTPPALGGVRRSRGITATPRSLRVGSYGCQGTR